MRLVATTGRPTFFIEGTQYILSRARGSTPTLRQHSNYLHLASSPIQTKYVHVGL